ncbi:MAG: hypothetical protein IRY91_14485, partial [Gemmatimonadaceae bacterium]|nr:hypothetical protein [Gemmatimonadaceae bacterium]
LRAVGPLAALALRTAALHAQGGPYPLEPSPVLDISTLARTPQVGGYLSLRETVRNDSSAFLLNRARATVTAAPLPSIVVRLQGDFSSTTAGHLDGDSTVHGFALTDAYVQLTPAPAHGVLARLRPSVIAGQFKQPFSLEYLTPYSQLLTPNRAQVVDNLAAKRDIGVMAQGHWGRAVTLALGVANGEGPNTIANPNGRQLVLGRLTVSPVAGLALSGKLANEGPDHLRGYDGRWLWRALIVEGEAIHRSRPVNGDAVDAGGGYVTAAYRVLPWLQPVFKHEWYRETRTTLGVTTDVRSEWSTMGANVLARNDAVRLQLVWVVKSEQPVAVRNNEIEAQLVAAF